MSCGLFVGKMNIFHILILNQRRKTSVQILGKTLIRCIKEIFNQILSIVDFKLLVALWISLAVQDLSVLYHWRLIPLLLVMEALLRQVLVIFFKWLTIERLFGNMSIYGLMTCWINHLTWIGHLIRWWSEKDILIYWELQSIRILRGFRHFGALHGLILDLRSLKVVLSTWLFSQLVSCSFTH